MITIDLDGTVPAPTTLAQAMQPPGTQIGFAPRRDHAARELDATATQRRAGLTGTMSVERFASGASSAAHGLRVGRKHRRACAAVLDTCRCLMHGAAVRLDPARPRPDIAGIPRHLKTATIARSQACCKRARGGYDRSMSSTLARKKTLPRMSRFSWLMALYAENHARFVRLFDPSCLAPGTYRSVVGDGLDLQLDVIEQHAYTSELRLTYAMQDPLTGEPDPSAFLRAYHDARQVEATHCYVGRRWQDVIGLNPPADALIGHRLRMNTFLGKWLEYLAERGHGMHALRRVDVAPDTSVGDACAREA